MIGNEQQNHDKSDGSKHFMRLKSESSVAVKVKIIGFKQIKILNQTKKMWLKYLPELK